MYSQRSINFPFCMETQTKFTSTCEELFLIARFWFSSFPRTFMANKYSKRRRLMLSFKVTVPLQLILSYFNFSFGTAVRGFLTQRFKRGRLLFRFKLFQMIHITDRYVFIELYTSCDNVAYVWRASCQSITLHQSACISFRTNVGEYTQPLLNQRSHRVIDSRSHHY